AVRGRADPAAHDRARPERTEQLYLSLSDLRGERGLRSGRAAPREGARDEVERSGRLYDFGYLLQPSGRVRQEHGRPQSASREGAEQPGGVLYDRAVLLGKGLSRLHDFR